MHKCGVRRVVTCSWWWLHSFPAFSFYKHFMLASSHEVVLVVVSGVTYSFPLMCLIVIKSSKQLGGFSL